MVAGFILIGIVFFAGLLMTGSSHAPVVRAFGVVLVIAGVAGFAEWTLL